MPDHVFVERPEPLEKLDVFLDRALGGEAVVCLLEGEAGAGKTSLLRNFADRVQTRYSSLLVAFGSCDSFTGTGDAYLPFREILGLLTGDVEQGLAEGRTNQENASRLKRFVRVSGQALVENGPDLVDIFVPGGALLARLGGKAAQKFPWIERLTAKISQPASRAEALTQDNVFEQYTQVLEALSCERPLILIVDDLHWADQASLGLLFHLSRRLINDPVLIVGAYRKEELTRQDGSGNTLKRVIGELKRVHGDININLDEMRSRAWLEAFVASSKNRFDQKFLDALSHHTACNPLFTVELLQHLRETGIIVTDDDGCLTLAAEMNWESLPSRIAGVIEARMGHLSELQRDLLNVACVQGEEFFAEPIASVLQEKLLRIVKELSGSLQKEQHITRAVGVQEVGACRLSVYQFRHNLFQRYLYQELDEIERTALHAEIGQALEGLAVDSDGSMALTLARHFGEARQWQSAAKYCVQAADQAARASAPEEALTQYERALALAKTHKLDMDQGIDVPALTEKLADQYALAARHDAAINAYDSALSATSDVMVEIRLLRKLSLPYQRTNSYDECLAILDRAERRLDTVADELGREKWSEWLEIQNQRCWIFYWRNQADALDKLHEDLRPMVDKWGTATQRILFDHSNIRLGLRRCRFRADRHLVALAREAYGKLQPGTPDMLRADGAFMLGFVLLWAEEFAEAIGALGEARENGRRCGDIVLRNRAITWLALAQRRLLANSEVAALLPECRELSEYLDACDYLGLAWSQQAWLAWRNGDIDEAEYAVRQALELWQEKSPNFPVQWPGLWVELALATREGNISRAVKSIEIMNRQNFARQPEAIHAQFELALAAAGNDREMQIRLGNTVELGKQLTLL